MSNDTVTTVLGPVASEELGITLPHEHLLMSFDWPGSVPVGSGPAELAQAPVTMELAGPLRKDMNITQDNYRLTDPEVAIAELDYFKRAGGGALVEMSVEGLGVGRERLAEISRRTGVHIVAGCGWYVEASHPEYVRHSSVDELAARLVSQIRPDGLSGDGQPACGIIGEIGVGGPPATAELKVLRAAITAQHETETSVSIHTNAWRGGEGIRRILETLAEEEALPRRTVIGHLDWGVDYQYIRAAAEQGYWLALDTFGYESIVYPHSHDPGTLVEVPCDRERVKLLIRLLDDGFEDQVLLSQDVYSKTALRKYGGYGYAHLLENIVVMCKHYRVDEALLKKLMTSNPQRMLVGR
jgi:phosphotriesterase-related protein